MTPTEVRLALYRNGYHPLPLNGKAPMPKGWQQKLETNEDEIALWAKTWPNATNTGVLCRFTPCLDIDLLNEDAAHDVEELVRERFEHGGYVLPRIGKSPKRAIPFRTEEPFAKIGVALSAPNGDASQKIEFLGDGQQFVADGVHPETQKPYAWPGKSLLDVPREELPYIRGADALKLVDDIVALLIAEHGYLRKDEKKPHDDKPTSDGAADWGGFLDDPIDHDKLCEFAMSLLRTGMSDGAAVNFLRVLVERQQGVDPDRKQRRLDEIPGMVKTARAKLQGPPSKDEPVFDPWARFIVPAFPFDILPQLVQDFVSAKSAAMGCDPSSLAMCALGTFSGSLHHGFKLKMMKNDEWTAAPRLWILVVGAVSTKKTPQFQATTNPLVHYEAHLRDVYRHALRDYEQAKKENNDTKMEKPEPPPHYVVWDTTVEKLGEGLARGDGRKGTLVLADEVAGWIGSMERYSAGKSRADRAFWLRAFDGGTYNVDRISRGETYIGNLSVSIIGGIQPTRLAEIAGLTSDGLLQRFIPVIVALTKFREDRASIPEAYNDLVRQMIFARPAQIIMTDDAHAIMDDLHKHLYDLEMASEGFAGGFQGFVGKLPGIAGSLALILHMANHLANNQRIGAGAADPVSEHTVENVRRLVLDFILPHANEFYCGAGTAEAERLQRLASWILTSGKDRLVASDLAHNVADFRGRELRDVNARVSPLVASGWLHPVDNTPNCRAWIVNPKVHTQLAERARTEDERKAAVKRLMGFPNLKAKP